MYRAFISLIIWQCPFKLNHYRITITPIEKCRCHFVKYILKCTFVLVFAQAYLFQIPFCWLLCKGSKWELICHCLHGQILPNSEMHILLLSWKFGITEFNREPLNFWQKQYFILINLSKYFWTWSVFLSTFLSYTVKNSIVSGIILLTALVFFSSFLW